MLFKISAMNTVEHSRTYKLTKTESWFCFHAATAVFHNKSVHTKNLIGKRCFQGYTLHHLLSNQNETLCNNVLYPKIKIEVIEIKQIT